MSPEAQEGTFQRNVPPGEARLQRLLAGVMLGMGAVLCAAFAAFDLLVTGYRADALAETVGAVVYLVSLGAVIRDRHLRLALHGLVATTTAIILIVVSTPGALTNAILVWPLVLPPLALLLIGLRHGWPYVVIAWVGTGAAVAAHWPMDVVTLANAGGAFFAITALSIYFAISRGAAFAALRQAAETDVLTGLPNRRAFLQRYDSLRAVGRAGSTPLALLLIEADHVSAINDTHGHDVGVRVLTALGRLIGGQLRPCDAMGRIGGETFAVALANTAMPGAVAMAEAMRRAVAGADLDPALSDGVTVSIGVAPAAPEDGGFPDHFARADARLLAAKASGRNRVVAEDGIAAMPRPTGV